MQSPAVPNFPAIFPATFHDATGSATPIPASFGARRTTFNFAPNHGVGGLVMSAAMEDEVLVQWTGYNLLAIFGVGLDRGFSRLSLGAGAITTTEFLSL